MPIPAWTSDDFLSAILRLRPRGRAWPTEPDSDMAQALSTLAPTYARSAARGAYLLEDAFPATAQELLPDWQATLGLPGPYARLSLSEYQQQQLVAARFASGGGQSVAYFIAFAATLGYTITITQFSPFRVGMTVGLPLYGEAWAYAWQVNAPTYSVEYFRVGRDLVGEPLATWGNTILQSELTRLKPAQTVLLFNYS